MNALPVARSTRAPNRRCRGGSNCSMNSPKRPGRPESPQSNATFPKRSEKPGEAGLANEARPGLGTRQDEGAKQDDGLQPLKRGAANAQPQDREPLGRNAPLPKREPRE